MVLPAPPAQGPGGVLQLEYVDSAAGERHQIKLHVCHFNQSPVGGTNDYNYDGTGPVVPTETSVIQTFNNFAALWQSYYPSDWSLSIIGLYWQLVDGDEALPDIPVVTPVAGTNSTSLPTDPVTKRYFRLQSSASSRRRLWLSQVPDTIVNSEVEVSPTTGGFDARDRAMINYLAGNTGGAVVAPDGKRFLDVADVRRWWARKLEAAPTGGGGSGGVDTLGNVATDCLTFPLNASICNPVPEIIRFHTPAAEWQFDETGLTLPGGSRLESF